MMPGLLSQMFLWVHLKEQEAGKHNLQQPQMPTWPFISVLCFLLRGQVNLTTPWVTMMVLHGWTLVAVVSERGHI